MLLTSLVCLAYSKTVTNRGVEKVTPFPAPRECAERFIIEHNGNLSTVIDPLKAYQIKLLERTQGRDKDTSASHDSTLLDIHHDLNAARLRGISSLRDLSGAIPCRADKDRLCRALSGGGGPHARLSRSINATRPIVFFRAWECSPPSQSSNPCNEISRGSLGNTLGYYWVARAGAKVAKADFVSLRDLHACPDEISAWLPAVVAAQRIGDVPSTKQAYAAAAKSVCQGRNNFIHLSSTWIRAVPEASLEIGESLRAWAKYRDFPGREHPPIDEVAIHLRCGDVLAQLHGQYGLLPFHALAAIIPSKSNVTVGIVTQPYKRLCSKAKEDRLAETATAHGASICACQCAYIIDKLVKTIQTSRPLARVSVHSNDLLIAAWARLALAPVATICQSSTFCLWPTIAATGHGYLVASSLFPQAMTIASMLSTVGVIQWPPLVPYSRLGTRKVRNACGTKMSDIRNKVAQLLVPIDLRPSDTRNAKVTGYKLPAFVTRR